MDQLDQDFILQVAAELKDELDTRIRQVEWNVERNVSERIFNIGRQLSGGTMDRLANLERAVLWALVETPDTCSDCRYWKIDPPPNLPPNPDFEGEVQATGRCRYSPPVVKHDPLNPQAEIWPITKAKDWCGKHRRSAPAVEPQPAENPEESANQ